MRLDLRNIPFYFLNTRERADRRQHMESRLRGFLYERIEGSAAAANGSRLSLGAIGHARAIDRAMRCMGRQFEPFVVLEDDVEWRECPSGPLVLEVPEYADAIHLGISNCGCHREHNTNCPTLLRRSSRALPHLQRVFNMLSTHAILFLSPMFCVAYSRAMMEACSLSVEWDTISNRLAAHYEVFALASPLFFQLGTLGGQEDMTRIAWSDEGGGVELSVAARNYHAIRTCSSLLSTPSPRLTVVAAPSCARDVEQLTEFQDATDKALVVCLKRPLRDRAMYDSVRVGLPFATILRSTSERALDMLVDTIRANPFGSYKFLFARQVLDACRAPPPESVRVGAIGEHPSGSAESVPALLGGDLDSLLEFSSEPSLFRLRNCVYELVL